MSRLERALEGARRVPRGDLALALLVVAVIAMMVVPLPTPLVDLLIAVNLGFGVLLIAGALYMRDALRFSAFPTLLLLSTLYRLALNVSSTRLILLQADAGRVIESFGSFVVRGDYRVGALVFAMLTLIQFIVIARGAERVAEVAARFSLDALPGKQLAIDAELRAGTLRPEQARAHRMRLDHESQLYGALDGALKFVKGDAIAGIVITLVNFVGGVAIGVFGRDLPLGESLQTYGLLTIGDGLVTQIPALLGATAAGLVVTRVSTDAEAGSLAGDIGTQLLHEPRALAVGALVLTGLALVPALPSWPFLAIALPCAIAAYMARRGTAHDALPTPVAPEPLAVELGSGLAARLLSRGRPTDALSSAFDRVAARLEAALGIRMPEPIARLSAALPPLGFRLVWRELPADIQVLVGKNPALDAIERTLEQLVRRRADDCLELDSVQQMVDTLAHAQPTLVRLTMPHPISPILLQEVLRGLVREGVSVRWLAEILPVIAAHAATTEGRSALLIEHARRALAHRISHAIAGQGALHLLRLAPEVEEALTDALRTQDGSEVLALAPDLALEITEAVCSAHAAAPVPHALVTQPPLRRHVRRLLADRAPDLSVVSACELAPSIEVSMHEPIGP